jgi:plastocyanin
MRKGRSDMEPRLFVWTKPGAAGLVLACVLAACGGGDLDPTGPSYQPTSDDDGNGRVVIHLMDNVPAPGHVEIRFGEVVEWKNTGINDHSVSTYGTPDEWKDTLLKPGERFIHQFSAPGEYAYICIVHGEIGDVIVREGSMDMDMDYHMDMNP